VAEAWQGAHAGHPVSEADIDQLFNDFVPMQLAVLKEYAEPIPGALDSVKNVRERGMKIGSTTGYLRSMMNILAPVAAARGYSPDSIVCPDEVPAGRPFPWMCYQNAAQLGVFPMEAILKVGDTLVDIEEGLNAGMWTVGLAMTGNMLGLTEAETKALAPEMLDGRRHAIYSSFYQSGAHYMINGIWDLPGVLDDIQARVAQGERP